jgi:hydroxyacid-oxoacid transhydrogenase
MLRPAYQGSNPVADIFSLWALQTTVKYLPRVAKDRDDEEARRQMLYVLSVCSYVVPHSSPALPRHLLA